MAKPVKNRGAGGSGSLVFSQKLDYPSRPNQITYYPPEPSPELKKRVAREKAGGISVYAIGFVICIAGYIMVRNSAYDISAYDLLIPLALLLGLIFAITYIVIGNVSLAKLSRALPKIVVVALFLLFIMNIITAINDMQSIEEPREPDMGASQAEWEYYNNTVLPQFENEMRQAFDDLRNSIINPAFFIMTIGLYIAGAGGNVLVSSTDIQKDYIPGMIILETREVAAGPSTPSEDCSPCPNCGANLTFIPQYERYYCYSCKSYAGSEISGPVDDAQTTLDDTKFCGACMNELAYIEEYDRFYCHSCKEYPKEDNIRDSGGMVVRPEHHAIEEPEQTIEEPEQTIEEPEQTIEEPVQTIEEPASTGSQPVEDGSESSNIICPSCRKDAKYIEQYSRWYCYECKKYL